MKCYDAKEKLSTNQEEEIIFLRDLVRLFEVKLNDNAGLRLFSNIYAE